MTTTDRRKRSQGAPAESNDADVAANQRPRRAVVRMRRRIERPLAVGDAAAEAEQVVLDSMDLSALRVALARYREVHDAPYSLMPTRPALACQSLAVISVLEASLLAVLGLRLPKN
jgi:hypothetical protein